MFALYVSVSCVLLPIRIYITHLSQQVRNLVKFIVDGFYMCSIVQAHGETNLHVVSCTKKDSIVDTASGEITLLKHVPIKHRFVFRCIVFACVLLH